MKRIPPNLTVLTNVDFNANGACSVGSSDGEFSSTSSKTTNPESENRAIYRQRSPRHLDLLRRLSVSSLKGQQSSNAVNWKSEAHRLSQFAKEIGLHLGKIDLSLVDPTMTFIDTKAHPSTYPKAIPSQEGLDALLGFWDPDDKLFFWIQFDRELRPPLLGATVPDIARIGPDAFNSTIVPTAGIFSNGEKSMQLSDAMISLQVIISAAHENTHLRQYDSYQYIDQDGHKKELLKLPEGLKCQIFNACQDQSSALEVLGYQSEVINLLKFHETHQKYLNQNPDYLLQWNELIESSLSHRDIHFDRMSEENKRLLLGGDIDKLMKNIHKNVPQKYIVDPR